MKKRAFTKSTTWCVEFYFPQKNASKQTKIVISQIWKKLFLFVVNDKETNQEKYNKLSLGFGFWS